MVKLNFSRELRIVTPKLFNNVFDNPIRASSPNLTILAKPNNLNHPRLGLIVPKKILKLAVWRNRVKRVIRNNFRLNQFNICPLDYVVIAKGNIKDLSNSELDELVTKLWKVICRRYKK
jgi:ribonuclease P protein component